MGFGGGGSSTPAVATTVATKAANYADSAVQDAYESTRKRSAAAGTSSTILTSGEGDAAPVGTAKKSLLGQ
ncbi:MAG: hypothetical protein RLZZ501_841 [Pseudomonadota bacterium]